MKTLALFLVLSSTSMAAQFKVGDCVKIKRSDPWERNTLKILEVGEFSYKYETHDSLHHKKLLVDYLSFKEINGSYESFDCKKL